MSISELHSFPLEMFPSLSCLLASLAPFISGKRSLRRARNKKAHSSKARGPWCKFLEAPVLTLSVPKFLQSMWYRTYIKGFP
jgi:hypothetical protein